MSKELVRKIIRKLNTVPVGIKFNFGPREQFEELSYSEPLNYCEVVYKAMRTGRTYLLDSSSISCQAAKEVFGIENKKLSELRNHFNEILDSLPSESNGEKILNSTEILKLKDRPESITVGPLIKDPDVYILFLSSEKCDKIINAYTQLFYNNKIGVVVDASNIMPVCYNCTVRPFLKGNISISWVLGDNENCNEFIRNCMVVGIPGDKIELFIDYIEEDKDMTINLNEV
jgi:uncharacterized protein (DUF169 family)